MRQSKYIIAVVVLILLAGCGGVDDGGATGPADTTAEPAPDFEVESITAPDSVERGSPMTVTATITNNGSGPGTDEISVRLNETVVTESVTLDTGESQRLNTTLENLTTAEGPHTLAVETTDTTATTVVTVENPTPYGLDLITVYLDDSSTDRNMSAPTQAGLDYWEDHDADYLEYDVTYERTTDRDDADLIVEYNDLEECDTEPPNGTDLLGCAPVVTDTILTQATVQIQQGMSDADTRETVIHELGHAHGLTHSDPPVAYMDNGTLDIASRDPLKIHLRSTGGEIPSYVREEVGDGLDYFDGHEDLRVGNEFNWEYVDSPEAAHLVITYDQADDGVCFESGGGSCTVDGPYVSQTEFRLEGMSTQAVPWHVSSRLAPYLLTEQPDGLDSDTDRRERERWS